MFSLQSLLIRTLGLGQTNPQSKQDSKPVTATNTRTTSAQATQVPARAATQDDSTHSADAGVVPNPTTKYADHQPFRARTLADDSKTELFPTSCVVPAEGLERITAVAPFAPRPATSGGARISVPFKTSTSTSSSTKHSHAARSASPLEVKRAEDAPSTGFPATYFDMRAKADPSILERSGLARYWRSSIEDDSKPFLFFSWAAKAYDGK